MANTVPELIMDSDLIVGDGPAGPEDVPVLVKSLRGEAARIRVEAVQDLGQIVPSATTAVPALLELARHDVEPVIRVEAARAVAAIDPKNESALPLLTEALKDGSGKVRRRAAECLGDLGSGARPAVAALVKAVSDADPTVSWAAIDALGQIGPDAEEAVPALVEALKEAGKRAAAVEALGQMGRKARGAVADLEKVLKGEDAAVRWATAAALVRIGGPGVKTGVRYLLETASRDRARNWTDANNILMAPTSREALPAMLDAVRDPAVRELASATAVDVSLYLTTDPLADVKALLQDRDAAVRCVSAWVLYHAHALDSKSVLPVLREALQADDPWARRRSADYLGALGPAARDAVPALTALLRDKNESVREAAAKALKAIGPN
jgi:HEAT repeat protein